MLGLAILLGPGEVEPPPFDIRRLRAIRPLEPPPQVNGLLGHEFLVLPVGLKKHGPDREPPLQLLGILAW